MKTTRRSIQVFSLSFLDVISCGFGAIVLLLVLTLALEPATQERLAVDNSKKEQELINEQEVLKDANSQVHDDIRTLEQAINHSLSLDSCTQEKLANYAGRVIQLRCTQPELTLYFRIDSSISVLQYFEGDADAGIQGSRGDWLALLTADDLASALINGKLVISGDTIIKATIYLKKIASPIPAPRL
mgnify:CR=1 FL=1